MKWGGMDVAYVFFLQESLDPNMKKLANNFIVGTEEYLTQRAATGDIGFVIERMQNGKYSDNRKPNDKRQSSPVTGLEWPRGFQEVKVPRFRDNDTGWW